MPRHPDKIWPSTNRPIILHSLPEKRPMPPCFRLPNPPVPSAISSTVVNFIATEYNDEDCSDPTGNTEIVTGRYAIFGAHTGECTQFWHFSDYSISECLEDGSTTSQHFSSDDITCSGDVRREIHTPLFSPPPCSTAPVDGLFYR